MMEPMRPDLVARILKDRPDVTHSDIEEYQRLQGEEFMTNPFVQKSPQQEEQIQQRQARIQELYSKLYR
jgi:hypothetical protein